jgi:hypothetical protein
VVAPLLLPPPPPIPQRPAAAAVPPSLLPSPALRAIRRRQEQKANWLDGEDDLLDEPHLKMVSSTNIISNYKKAATRMEMNVDRYPDVVDVE